MGANLPPGEHGQAPRPRARETGLRNIPGSKRVIKKVLRFDECALRAFSSGPLKSKPRAPQGKRPFIEVDLLGWLQVAPGKPSIRFVQRVRGLDDFGLAALGAFECANVEARTVWR
jgi:hypothetical protein